MQNYSDEKLVEIYRLNTGNQRRNAFDCLYVRYLDNLRNYFFFALGRDNEKAKDFAHDLFIKILESPEKFDPSRNFKPWLYRVASNMCKNEYRQNDVIGKYKSFATASDPDFESSGKEIVNLRECLKQLKPEKRSLIVLRFKIKLSINEIAQIYECPGGTIKSRLFYAIKELSEIYKR